MTKGFVGVVAVAAALSLTLLTGASALAAGTPVMKPSQTQPHGWWDWNAVPGQVIHDSFTLTNEGPAPASYSLSPADGVTSSLSGIVYNNQAVGDGGWVHLSETKLTLASKASREVPFTVTLPRDARPGDHVAAIAAANDAPAVSGGQFSLSVTDRTIVAVVLHVPGPVQYGVSVGSPTVTAEQRRQILTVPLTYLGNVLLKPHLTVLVRNSAGKVVVQRDSALDTFAARSAIGYPIPLDDIRLPAGRYCSLVTFGRSGQAQEFHDCWNVTPAAAAVPEPGHRGPIIPAPAPPWILIGAAILVGFLCLLLLLRRWLR